MAPPLIPEIIARPACQYCLFTEENKRGTIENCRRGAEAAVKRTGNMYPPCPQPELALEVEPHTDMSSLAVLSQMKFQAFRHGWKDGDWIAVKYLPMHSLSIPNETSKQLIERGKKGCKTVPTASCGERLDSEWMEL
ncbi:hypothetical protein NC652_005973 [Populus alba x Populus x berolinensis]|nr:hypothetical protein NC652_005973 [Populus alba x Populus x berolinensis]